jgi:hypothetical protein
MQLRDKKPKSKNMKSYINKNLRKVSKDDLLKALREVNRKNEDHRRQLQQGLTEALQKKIICTGGNPDIKPLL